MKSGIDTLKKQIREDSGFTKQADNIIKRANDKEEKKATKVVTSQDVIDFVIANPNSTDDQFHGWAEGNGFDVRQAEAEMYKLATKYISFLNAGFAKKKGLTKEKANKQQLAKGKLVEMEHTTDPEIAERIALDHLAEHPNNYYTGLEQMEKLLEKLK